MQDASSLFCLSLFSGHLEWTTGWPKGAEITRPPFDPAVGEGHVFAILPKPAPPTTTSQPGQPDYIFMGINTDGTHIWQHSVRTLTQIVGDGDAFFQSNPIWYEHGLYAVVAGQLGAIADTYLVRLNPQTGTVVVAKASDIANDDNRRNRQHTV